MRVYLLGPMTGYPDENRPEFALVTETLRNNMGHEVLSPHEIEDGSSWEENLRLDLIAILMADVTAGVALDGWENSKGAALEVHVLRTLGKPIYRLASSPDRWVLEEVKEPSKYRPPTDENILEEAMRLTVGDRDEDYGHPADDFSRTAGAWSSLFGWDATPVQVALAMIVVKISRLQKTPKKRDSVVDIAGYARTVEMTWEKLDSR